MPHDDLAVQWDAAVETVTTDQQPEQLEAMTTQLAALVDHLPAGAPVPTR
ncbi:hypothetical protein [Streptomyces sp. NPDC050164]